MTRPSVVVFDVNETLSDMRPLGQRFAEAGAPAVLWEAWFAATLRDVFALTAVGSFPAFRDVALATARSVLRVHGGEGTDLDAAAEHVVAGFLELDVHPDVPGGMRRLAEAGVVLVTLTNGSTAITERLLERAGLLDLVDHRLEVGAVQRYKPAPEPYRHAVETAGASGPGDAAMVAVHPWDTHGAQQAGLVGAYLDRSGAPWPGVFDAPHVAAPDLETLADRLLAR